jgi:hypothetical protein
MGEMEWVRLDSRKKGHDAIVDAISYFDRAGYLVSGACFKDGALEVVCYPPDKEGSNKDINWVSLDNPESPEKAQ